MTVTDFDKLIWRDMLTFVDFFATWCSPCQTMHPIVDRFQERMNARVGVFKIDVEDQYIAPVIQRYAVKSVPTLMFFRHGEVLWRKSGVTTYEELERVLQEIEAHEHIRKAPASNEE